MNYIKRVFTGLIIIGTTITTHANTEMQVAVTKTSDWDSGFCSKVNVYNPTDNWKSWEITFEVKGMLTALWDVNYTYNTTTLEATAWGKDWSEYIGPKKDITFGYCATKIVDEAQAPKEGELLITQTTQSAWDGGFCNQVEVSNISTHKIDWEINIPIEGEISVVWSANYQQDSETLELHANGLDWNNAISQNNSISFGYCANDIQEEIQITEYIPDDYLEKHNENTTSHIELFDKLNLGFGGSYYFPFTTNTPDEKISITSADLVLNDNIENNDYYNNIQDFDAEAFDHLQSSLKKSKFLVYWMTENWEESWFNVNKIQEAMNAGYVPVFNYWYLGDKLMNGLPNADEQEAYTNNNQKVINFLNKLNGTKLLIMEPEFNKDIVIDSEQSQHQFSTIIGKAIDTIRNNTSNVFFSLAMMDKGSRGASKAYAKCGYENCALGDKYEWGKTSIIYNNLLNKLDFISFQQMVGQFSRDPSNLGTWNNPNPKSYSNDDIGIDYLAKRILNLTEYLATKYNKPIFLPYMSVATATWSDINNNNIIEDSEINEEGWEEKADNVYRDLSLMKSELQDNGLFGFAPMALFDNPRHDQDGYQYFMQNEYHLGIMKSSAQSELDIASHGDIQSKGSIINNLFNSL